MNDTTLWYFADPMCSWCWGFSPVIEAIRENYRDRMKVALILGGLRPGTVVPMSAKEREDILHHWHDVHAMTGQPFRFDGALAAGFVYDTEPASRAVLAMAQIDREAVFPLFKSIQSAFYVDGADVTQAAVLAQLAADLGADHADFMRVFESDASRNNTQAHFQMARRLGVRGFPTLVLQHAGAHRFLSNGYRPLAELETVIDQSIAAGDMPPS